MGIHLVTGYAGKEHITAADQGAYQAGVVGPGKYVLQSGSMFEAQVVSNNLIKIKDGDLLNQGRHIHIATNDYEECIIENGTQSMKRNDLIVVRYTRNPETSIETAQILVIKGTPAATAVDPGYITGDILNGAVTDDFLLYRVKLDGLSIIEVESLFTTVAPYKELVEKVGVLKKDLELTLKVTSVYNCFNMTANIAREITPAVAGLKSIDGSRIVAAIPVLVATSSGNYNDNLIGASATSVANVKLQSVKTQDLYVRIYYIYK